MCPWDFLSTFPVAGGPSINFFASAGLSINFREHSVRPRDFTSMLHASVGMSVNFHQLSMCPRDLCQLFLHLRDLQWTSVTFPCVCGTFHQVLVHPWDNPTTFRASTRLSVNFRAHYMRPRNLPSTFVRPQDLPSTSVNFCTFSGPTVNIPYIRSTFHQLPSTFRAPAESSVNILRGHRTFRQPQLTFRASAKLP